MGTKAESLPNRTPTRYTVFMKVGIVGGSIAGCAAAIELVHRGYDVTILERARALADRGLGLVLPPNLMPQIAQQPLRTRHYVVRDRAHPMGRTIWAQPLDLASTEWRTLHQHLGRQVPATAYQAGVSIQSLAERDDGLHLGTTNGAFRFDAVIAADGSQSTLRNLLWPDLRPTYAGYVLVRGMAPNIDRHLAEALAEVQMLIMHSAGHALAYLVPNGHGGVCLNWAFYCNASSSEYSAGLLAPTHRSLWLERAATIFPEGLLGAVNTSPVLHLQPIYDLLVPSAFTRNIAFIGDAAATVRPHTGAGASRAVLSARRLGQVLDRSPNWQEALAKWSGDENQEASATVMLGRALGHALQQAPEDWSTMTATQAQAWWHAIPGTADWYGTQAIKL